MNKNITPYQYKITMADRRNATGQNSFVILFTGLSGSGKSTLANALESKLFAEGYRTYVLDGDNIRSGIHNHLGFSPEDRSENIRKIGELARLFIDAGIIVLAAFVAPYSEDRQAIRDVVGKENYIEVFVNTSLAICEARDPKGLYARARKGEIEDMTGVDAPYEIPLQPNVEIPGNKDLNESVAIVYQAIKEKLSID